MTEWLPFLALAVTSILLLVLNRWINQHLQGVGLLLTGSEEASLYFYFVVLLPGVIIHELSHWLAAKALGMRTGRVRLWPAPKGKRHFTLGSVEVSRADVFRDSLVGLAPLVVGCAILLAVSHFAFDVKALSLRWGDPATWVAWVKSWAGRKDFWLWLYLVFCVSNAMLPSAKDREPWTPVLIFLAVAGALFYAAGWNPRIPPQIAKTARVWTSTLAWSLGFAVAVNVLWALGIAVVEKSVELITGRRILY